MTSPIISPDTPSTSAALHPVLQAALENLDVQLEEELTRYRRQRRLQPDVLRRRSGFIRTNSAQDKAIDLPQFPLTVSAPAALDAEEATGTIAVPAPDSIASRAIAQDSPAAISIVDLSDASQSSKSGAPIAVSSAALAAEALQSPAAESSIAESVIDEDYFASSEELLRSISEETPDLRAAAQPDRLLDTLLTPLGIGSLLLLLLSTATLGYLVMNPTSLEFLTRQKSPEAGPAPAQPAGSPAAIAPPAPDLAAREFVDLNLNTLSSLPKPSPKAPPKPSPSPSSQVASQPLEPIVPPATNLSPLPPVTVSAQPAVIEPAPVDPRPVRSAPAPSYEAPPAPVSRPAEPASRAASPIPEVAVSPARSDLYHVVTPYRSDDELNQVQQSVPDAYVRNFSDGALVQMGAFSDESKAEELVQELQQQGIQAEIRRQD